MERKSAIAIAIVALVVTSGVVVVLTLQGIPEGENPTTPTLEYHYERDLVSTDPSRIIVRMDDIVDCEITISFANDTSLLYSVDIEFYEPMIHGDDFNWFDNNQGWIGVNTGTLSGFDPVRVKSIGLVLGNSCVYDIAVEGWNVSASILYDNGIHLSDDSYFQYKDWDSESGDVLIFMDSDVNVTGCDLNIGVSGADIVTLDIRNPQSLGGIVNFHDGVLGGVQLLGWSQGGYSGNWEFSRTATEEMLINISLLTQN